MLINTYLFVVEMHWGLHMGIIVLNLIMGKWKLQSAQRVHYADM